MSGLQIYIELAGAGNINIDDMIYDEGVRENCGQFKQKQIHLVVQLEN